MEGRAAAEVDAFHQVEFHLSAEVFGMFFHALDQLGTAQAIGKAGIILDFVSDGHLATQLSPGDDDRRQLRAGGIEGGGQAGRPRSDNDDTFLLHLLCLILYCR